MQKESEEEQEAWMLTKVKQQRVNNKKIEDTSALLMGNEQLMLMILQYLDNSQIYQSTLTVNKLLSRISFNALDTCRNDNFAIKYACSNNYLSLLHHLLQDKRVNPSVDDNAPLLIACERGFVDAVKLLLPRVDVSLGMDEILLISCSTGQTEVVKVLLEDERIDISDVYHLAIQMANSNQHGEVVKLLKRRSSLLRPAILVLNAITALLLVMIFVFPDSFKQ